MTMFFVQLSDGRTVNLAHIFDVSDESEGGVSIAAVILTNGTEFVYEGEDADKIFAEMDYFLKLAAAMKARFATVEA